MVWSKKADLGEGPGQVEAVYFCCFRRGCGMTEVQPSLAISPALDEKMRVYAGLGQIECSLKGMGKAE